MSFTERTRFCDKKHCQGKKNSIICNVMVLAHDTPSHCALQLRFHSNSLSSFTLVNVYVDLVVFTRIAGTL